MRNRLHCVIHRLSTSYVNHRVLEAFVREPVRILRVLNGDSVNFKAVRIDIRLYRTESDCPYAVLALLQFSLRRKLCADDH